MTGKTAAYWSVRSFWSVWFVRPNRQWRVIPWDAVASKSREEMELDNGQH